MAAETLQSRAALKLAAEKVWSHTERIPNTYEVELVARTELARGYATGPPLHVHLSQVVEHGLRHLAWLVREDEAIHHVLTDWSRALSEYEPEPFRAFGREPGSYVAQTLPRVVLTAQTGRWETGDPAMRRRGTIPADDEVR